MARLEVVLFVGLAFLVAGCVAEGEASGAPAKRQDRIDASALPPPEDGTARIIGTVTDDSLEPLAGADVGVIGADPPILATSNDLGQFLLSGLAPGTYNVAVQKLGYETAGRAVTLAEGEQLELNFVLAPIPVLGEARHFTIIGEGYFACGADTPVVTWGNLHACVWDNHKPNISFEAPKPDLFGIMQEVVWQQSSGLTSQRLSVSLVYGHVCNPFCSQAANFGSEVGPSPVRMYTEFDDKDKDRVPLDPMPLKSVTFPNRDDQPFVIVFQQRMTHYITLFWANHGDLETFTAIPDA